MRLYVSRREVLAQSILTAAGSFVPASVDADTSTYVEDITRLNPVQVAKIIRPRAVDGVIDALKAWSGPISIGGSCFSMGGQIASEGSLHVDMRELDQLVWLDPAARTVRVQAGMTWRALQERLDPHDLSVKIMQSYANFTIGGALSVNAHGRYVGLGPIVNSVRRIQLAFSDGTLREASPIENADLFGGVIGGYGALGIVTEVELDLVPNVRIERRMDQVSLADYPAFFAEKVHGAVMHNADLDPASARNLTAVTWFQTSKPVTIAERLSPKGGGNLFSSAQMWALAELPGAHDLRRNLIDPLRYAHDPVVWRNHEASLDVGTLGPIATSNRTYALQEYFVPIARFEVFAGRMVEIITEHEVNALNVSIRHAPADSITLLNWASSEVFSFVLYYRQHRSLAAQEKVGIWTRALIDAALELGGSYYLPYQIHATRGQFLKAYPKAPAFFALKNRFDPGNRFRNKLWNRYYET